MAYEWGNEQITYGSKMFFYATKGGVTISFDGSVDAPEFPTQSALAGFMGDLKDALETAGFTVPVVNLLGQASKTLEEAP